MIRPLSQHPDTLAHTRHDRIHGVHPGGKQDRTTNFIEGSELASLGAELPVVGVALTAVGLLVFAVAAVILVVPALIFLAEPVLIAILVGLGILGRVLLGRPWTVEAHEHSSAHAYDWKTAGWRASRDLIESGAQQIQETGIPTGGTCRPLH